MNRMSIVAAVGFALVGALPAAPANAQAARTFVSPTGSDSNNCSLAAPCRSFAAAFAVTNASGEIAVLGTAGYGVLTINKAISIVNPGAFEAGIVVPSGGVGIIINAGASDAISLRGLTIEGGGAGVTGIQFSTGGSLTIENSVVRNLTSSGIAIAPGASATIVVSNTVVSNNGGHGIYVQPSGSGTVTASFNRVEAYKNVQNGIAVYGNASTGTVKANAVDSAASNNGTGFYAFTNSGQAPTTLMVVRSVAANNSIGLETDGSGGASLYVGQSMITGNTTDWSSGGGLQTFGDNYFAGNTNSNGQPGIVPKT